MLRHTHAHMFVLPYKGIQGEHTLKHIIDSLFIQQNIPTLNKHGTLVSLKLFN